MISTWSYMYGNYSSLWGTRKHICTLVEKSLWFILTNNKIWHYILIEKYIVQNTLMHHIRLRQKNTKLSNKWRAITFSFPIVGNILAWVIWLSTNIQIQLDPIARCCHNIFIIEVISQKIQGLKKSTFNKTKRPTTTTLWEQGWIQVDELGVDMLTKLPSWIVQYAYETREC